MRRTSKTHRNKLVREAREYFKHAMRELRLSLQQFRRDRDYTAILNKLIPLWKGAAARNRELLRTFI